MNGQCTCGNIRYRLNAQPLVVHCCHCRWCQRETGSAFVLNALIETDRLDVLTGEPDAVPVPSESGNGQIIFRCPTCKVAVWSVYPGAGPQFLFVRAGTLDAPDLCPPDVHIYTENKQGWIALPDDRPVFEKYYRRSEVWPEGSLKRREAVLARAARD